MVIINYFRQCFAVYVLLVVTGCAVQMPAPSTSPPHLPSKKPIIERPKEPLPPSTRPKYNLMGYPPASQEGYIDGCETAKQTKWGFKDTDRYDSDGQYRTGWDDGFFICSKNNQS